MTLENIKNIIKEIFVKPDKKEWFDKHIENLEAQSLEDINLPFKIIELKKTGFLVKVSGLYAFVSFNSMPWKYSKFSYWTSIAPKLIGKIFFCRIHSIKKEALSIIINGEIPQFKKTEILIGENYRGIIIEKIRSGIIIEIGYHFNWRCGSFVGFLHKSQFNSVELFSSCSVGDEIEILYCGLNEKGQLVYSQIKEVCDWINDIPQDIVGQIVLVHVVRESFEEEAKFLVSGKYNGKIILQKSDSFPGGEKKVRKIISKLKDGEIIHCEVIGIMGTKRILNLKWIAELDLKIIENYFSQDESVKTKNKSKGRDKYRVKSAESSIMNSLDEATIQKMIAIRNEIELTEKHCC